ncbi:MAG: mechanosensitive ion channel family protein [Clostridiales bacterium]|nr:mechanosensitive ion channel family protein [Clostridiales bacterium]
MTDTMKTFWLWLTDSPKEGPVDFIIKVILALVVYVVGSKIIGWLCRGLRKQMTRFGTDEAAKSFLLSLVKIGLHVMLILTIAGNLGVDKTSVAALVGSAGVAISLALQGGLSNFAGGLIILFLRPFSVGDYIIENGEKNEGTVEKIELYYTTLMTVDSRRIVIPNSMLTNNSITNVTAMDKRRLEVKVGISYDADLLKAKEIIRELIEKDPELLEREEIQIFVDQLADSAVILGLRAWVKTEEFWPTKWRMQEEIKLEFDKNGIQIPFPQMDVHVKEFPKQTGEKVQGADMK